MTKKTLIVSGHPDLADDSLANKVIIDELLKLLPGAEADLLDRLYPDYRIDRAAEQEKLLATDVIILQFPLFWYHMPSLLERWMEQSFKHGFSHGSKGDKLKGKKVVVSFTAGAPEEVYTGETDFSHLVIPAVKAMCRLTQMEYVGYVFTGGVSYADRATKSEGIVERAREHARKVAAMVEAI